MAVDNHKTEWHLTPRGWELGTARFFGTPDRDGEIPPPADRIETWERSIYQRSAHSPEEVDWRRIWFDPAVPDAERDALREQYPPGWRAE